MRLYVLDCGTLFNRDPGVYGLTADQVSSVDMANPCFLVEHPEGNLLWETGLNQVGFGGPEGGGVNHDKMRESLQSQLAEIGHTPADITYLAISHVHGDHSGNTADFAAASTWIVQQAERDYMFGDDLADNLRPDEYAALENAKTVTIQGDHDVFGDGSVMLISTPGHTPGHQSLLVKLPNTGAVMLTGDLYHFPNERNFKTMPEREQSLETPASREKFEALVESEDARVWIQHDFVGNLALKKSPEYYD